MANWIDRSEGYKLGVKAMREAAIKAVSGSMKLGRGPTAQGPMTDGWNTACLVLQDVIADLPDPEPPNE